MTLCGPAAPPCSTDCKTYEIPLSKCFSPPVLFPGDRQWGRYDVFDVCHGHYLNRSFFSSTNGSCFNRTDGFVLPLHECVGPFGNPRPDGFFSCTPPPSSPPLDPPALPLWPQDPWQGAGNTLFPAPTSSEDHAEWLEGLRAWQTATRAAAGIPAEGGEVHQVPELRWTQTSYIQPQVHTYDRMLWNETGAHYTVDRYLDDCERRYGGIDSVLLWPTYPNLGLDERNQFDLIRLAELGGAIETFHARGVHVLLPYNPWDTATRRESTPDETTLAELSVQLQTDGMNGDTIQRVSRSFYTAGLAAGRALAIEPEGGGYPDTNMSADAAQWSATNWSPLGWGYCWLGTAKSDNETTVYLAAPGVDRAKWLEPQGRHLTHVTDRWRKRRVPALQLAFFNANGYESWENVWGLWNGITARDAESVRRVATLLRFFGEYNFTRNYAPASGWVPHTPEALGEAVFASRFEQQMTGNEATAGEATAGEAMTGETTGSRLWLLVNAGDKDSSGPVLRLDDGNHRRADSSIFVDAYHGVLLRPTRVVRSARAAAGAPFTAPAAAASSHASVELSFELEAYGFGAVVEIRNGSTTPPPALASLMTKMRAMSAVPLAQLDDTWRPLTQTMEPVPSSELASAAEPPPPEMVAVPRNERWLFAVAGVEVEGGCDPNDDPEGVCCRDQCSRWGGANPPQVVDCQCGMEAADDAGNDVQFPWESHPRRNHRATLDLGPFWIDRTPVTREAYRRYLLTSGYRPADVRGFLPQWKRPAEPAAEPAARSDQAVGGAWTFPPDFPNGTGALPVTGVSHEEADEYCRALGKRLPTTYEWQYAAQGNSTRRYPWGDVLDTTRFPKREKPDGSRNVSWTGPAPVDAFFNGKSPFGMADVVGNVWQWTATHFVDSHTRSVILRGSSSYVPGTNGSEGVKFDWYFQPSLELNTHNRWLAQMGMRSYSRAATVGFRCLKDVPGGAPAPLHYRSATPRHTRWP